MVWLHALRLPLVNVVPAITLLALANAAHVPSSNGYYNVSGTDGSIIVIYAISDEPEALYYYHNQGFWGAEAVWRIATPWPFLLCKAGFSLLLYLWNSMDSGDSSCLPEWIMFAIKYLFNVFPCAGSLGYMIKDLWHGGTIPSYGVVITLMNFSILKFPSEQYAASNGQVVAVIKKKYVLFRWAAIFIIYLGQLLFLLVGLVAIGHGRNGSEFSFAVRVEYGCPSGFNSTDHTCAQVGPYSYSVITGGDQMRIGFWVCGVVAAALSSLQLFRALYKLKRFPRFLMAPQAHPRYKKATALLVAITFLFSLLNLRYEQDFISSNYWNCWGNEHSIGNTTLCLNDSISINGDTYGFWTFWLMYKLGIIKGIFVW